MTEVDQRVVQMRFDDKDFDEKAKKTMKTLDKLSEKLSFSTVAQKSDAALEEVVDNVEKMANQAYTIVDRVIDKIRDNIANKLVDFIKSATIDQVANGWRKYSDMTTAVGTLLSQGHKIEKVNKTLEDLSYFADETSYSFNDMLSGIAKFTAAGVGLDDAKVALMGISNWAAQSGQNAETASRVFGQLAQAMGTYMKKQDWMSVQTANMDTQEFRQTALDTAVALGTLKKVGENTYKSLRATTKKGAEAFTINSFVESLTQGAWMTSEVMVETYKKYATAVEKIKKIYDDSDGQFTGQIVRQRQQINRDLIKQYSEIYKVTEDTAQKELDKWSTVQKATKEEVENYAKLNKISEEIADKKINASYYNAVAEYSKRTRKSIKDTEKDLEQWSEYISEFSLKAFLNAQEARTFTDVINSVKESAASAWRTIYTSIFGDYNEAKVLWTDMAEGLIGLFTDRLSKISEIFEEWKNGGGRDQMWRGLYAFGYGISAAIENIRDAWDKLITGGESGVAVLDRISTKIEEAGFKFYGFVDALVNNGFFQNVAEALHNIKYFIDQVFGALYDGVRDAIPGGNFFLGLLIEFSSIIKEITSNFKLSDAAVDGLRRTFKGLFIILNHSKKTIVDVLVKIVLPILNAVFSVLGNIIDVVVTITGTIGDIIEYFMPLDAETSSLVKILSVLVDIITTIVKLVGNALAWALQKIVPIIGVALGAVANLVKGIADLFEGKSIKMGDGSKLVKGFKGLKDKILEAWEPLKSFSEIIDEYKNGKGLTNFLNLFADMTEGIGNRLLLTLDATAQFLEVMSDSKFGKALRVAISVIRWVIRAGLWLFNNLFVPALKEIITELGLTIESIKGIIDERGILGLLDLIQEVFQTGIFASLVKTINLINSVIGGEGLGKLFNKGAKVLESISDYFNAAKLNQSADVLLKVVAALMLLYTLLALITFLPVDNYERMRKAMFEMAIALAMVVGAVFVISAAAALAGGNLIAMAAGFIGVAIAINTALWALKKMVEFTDEVNETKIKAGLDKLKDILDVYAWFIIKAVAPVALIAGKSRADVGGVGIAMAGLAASIWLLINALKGMDEVDTSQMEGVFEFLSGIYLILAGSTALLLFAAGGKDVHGIAIAIASIGVAFAAIKFILPLCKDIIAEKDVFMDAQSALATFGLFMLAFSASMYFITSGVQGLISGIASILLFRAYIHIVTDQVIPLIEKIMNAVVRIGNILNSANLKENGNWIPFASALGAIIVLFAALAQNFRWIFGLWSEFDPVAAIAICLTVVGTMLIFSNKVIPAVKQLNDVIKNNSSIKNAELGRMIFFLFVPVLAMMAGFALVMDSYVDMYNKSFRNNRIISVNAGIVTREFNGAASVFQSIMISFLALYGGIVGILYLTKDIQQPQVDAILDILNGIFTTILAVVVPMTIMWTTVTSYMEDIYINDYTKNRQLVTNFNKAMSAISGSITGLVGGLVVLFLVITGASFILAVIDIEGALDRFTTVFETVIGAFIKCLLIVSGISVIVTVATVLVDKITGTASGILSAVSRTGQMLRLVTTTIGLVAIAFSILTLVSAYVSSFVHDEERYSAFQETMVNLAITFGLILLGIALFVKSVAKTLKGNALKNVTKTASGIFTDKESILSMSTTAKDIMLIMLSVAAVLISIGAFLLPGIKKLDNMNWGNMVTIFLGILGILFMTLQSVKAMMNGNKTISTSINKDTVMNRLVNALGILFGVVGPIIAIGTALLPAMAKLESMDIGKIIAIFAGLIVTLMVSLGAIGVMFSSSGNGIGQDWTGKTTGLSKFLDVLKMAAGVVGPILSFALALSVISDVYTTIAAIPRTTITKINEMIRTISILMGIMMGVGVIGGISKGFATGFIIIAGGLVALAGAIWLVANAITGLHKAFNGGMEDGLDEVKKTATKTGETATTTLASAVGYASPAKEFIKIGKFCDLGLAKGMNDNRKKVALASAKLGDTATDAIENDLGIASPSKVFYKEGRFIVAGLTQGVKSGKSALSDAMGDLGDTLSKSFKDSLGNLKLDASGIFGDKDPIEYIKEGLGNLDGGSLLGKMFGLDQLTPEEQALVDKYQEELDGIRENASHYGMNATTSSRASWLEEEINRITNKSAIERAGDKAKSALQGLGKQFGIDIAEGASSDDVIGNLTNKLVGGGVDDPNSVLGKIGRSIKTGDWSSIGDSIGDSLVNPIINKFADSAVAKGLMKLGWKFGLVSNEEYNNYLAQIGGISEQEATVRNATINSDVSNPQAARYLATKEYEEEVNKTYGLIGKSVKLSMKELAEYSFAIDSLIKSAISQGKTSEEIAGYIIQGFTEGWGDVKDDAGKVVDFSIEQLIALVRSKLGIASPSKVFKKIAIQTVEGAVVGTKEEAPKLQSALEDMTDDQINTMSLAMQAMDEMASGTAVYTPRIVPTVDSASLNASLNTVDSALRVDPAKVNSSLNVETDTNQLAQSQYAMAGAIDNLRNDILTALATGELVKVDVETHTDESNLFDFVVRQNRLKYNRTGINSMLT